MILQIDVLSKKLKIIGLIKLKIMQTPIQLLQLLVIKVIYMIRQRLKMKKEKNMQEV
jgi:hypothetical protein